MSETQKTYGKRVWNGVLVPAIVSVTWYAGHCVTDYLHPEWTHILMAAACGWSGSFLAIKLWRK